MKRLTDRLVSLCMGSLDSIQAAPPWRFKSFGFASKAKQLVANNLHNDSGKLAHSSSSKMK